MIAASLALAGGVPERLNGPVSKTGKGLRSFVGSNPTPSARRAEFPAPRGFRLSGGIELADALAVCAVVARQEPAEFDRYAVRWIAAAIKERDAVDLPFLLAAIAALERLRRDGRRR